MTSSIGWEPSRLADRLSAELIVTGKQFAERQRLKRCGLQATAALHRLLFSLNST
jgi:hypothetical protein